MDVNTLIRVEGLWHTYLAGTPLETVALRGVDMEVKRGEAVGLIGPTGSGKSTLVQHFNGLLRPQRGKVYVDGQDLGAEDIDLRAIRRKVGLIFQYPEQQLFETMAGDDVAFGPRNLGLSQELIRQSVREAMELVGLNFEQFKDRYTFSLSSGEMRRLAIAGVLALQPEVLVMDEPTMGLDPQGRNQLLTMVKSFQRERGITVILVSHDMEEVAELVDHIYVIVEGRTVLHGPPRQVFSQARRLRSWGLTIPQVTAVFQELRSRGEPVRTDIITIDEAEREIWRILNSCGTSP
ncbi:MAG: energy-coupling factor transporter ATPase [Chloroflexi bacterium]|nr:energy-coupling factor transporter ATPase [Chloroflexota bacterium]MCL5075552.1 energy-coupling factor transporter ATPase [Chloroflexota bacterium]